MMYHAESFANISFNTYIIGNKGTYRQPSVRSDEHDGTQVQHPYRPCCLLPRSTSYTFPIHQSPSPECPLYSLLLVKFYCKFSTSLKPCWWRYPSPQNLFSYRSVLSSEPHSGVSEQLILVFIIIESKNPPSIPTLALVWLVGRIRGSKVIIDWHNLGYSILALKLGDNHPFVIVAKWYVLGRRTSLLCTNGCSTGLNRTSDTQRTRTSSSRGQCATTW